MKIKFKFCLLLLISIILLTSANAQINWKQAGKQSFMFTNNGKLKNPLKVFYYNPEANGDSLPIVILLHGAKRNPSGYMDDLIAAANVFHCKIIAPEFDTKNYPGADGYNSGNVYNKKDNFFNAPEAWSFSLIEPLFDYVVKESNSISKAYYLYGHSAGGQFVHRFLTFVPNNRVIKAAAANAGWYTLPSYSINFPFGLNKAQIPENNLKEMFQKKVFILVGEADTDTTSPDFNDSPQANQQGINRFERGQYYFNACKNKAAGMKTNFNWTQLFVPNIGHNNKEMGKFAFSLFFMDIH
jgi:poly(3-hydroxybutyrate) depolymerase